MFKSLKDLYVLLTKEQKSNLKMLQGLIILMSLLEVLSILLIAPFMALVGDFDLINQPGYLNDIYVYLNFDSKDLFLSYAGFFVLLILTISAFISIITSWKLSMYGTRVGADLGLRLFRHYMQKPWIYHVEISSSKLSSNISQECSRITGNIINPLMQMNAKLVTGFMISVGVFIYEPIVSIFTVLVFGSAYFVLYKTVRKKLIDNGDRISKSQTLRFKLMTEGFGGIKDLLFMGRQGYFVEAFRVSSNQLAFAQGNTQVLSQVPRYAMELIAFGGVIFLVLFLLAQYGSDLSSILPILSVFALAGFKLLPAFQLVYTGISQVRGNLSAFESVKDDLIESTNQTEGSKYMGSPVYDNFVWSRIALREVTFTYPGRSLPSVKDFNMEIPARSVVGIVGSSGSGKSTLVDILLGLLTPQKGGMLIDNDGLCANKCRAWQSKIGFIPQSIFLADSSVRENVAFGVAPHFIDDNKVAEVLKLAHLDDFISTLPAGVETNVGERGLQLSGGQRQRIGIARALYHDPEVLIMDEATSALDGISEEAIMQAIGDFSGKKTIIMIAHRLTTVRQCDVIYFLDKGQLIDVGSFQQLVDRNSQFKHMAGLS